MIAGRRAEAADLGGDQEGMIDPSLVHLGEHFLERKTVLDFWIDA